MYIPTMAGGNHFNGNPERSGQDEVFDIVDERDAVIGRATRAQCHGNPALIHRAAHVLVFNPAGALYLQKRSMNKDVAPGRWDTSVGGHVDAGESYEAAAVREMREELGISGVALEYLYALKTRNQTESENVRTFRCVYDGTITPDPAEIAEGRFWTFAEIAARLGSGVFTGSFEHEFAAYTRTHGTLISRSGRPGGLLR